MENTTEELGQKIRTTRAAIYPTLLRIMFIGLLIFLLFAAGYKEETAGLSIVDIFTSFSAALVMTIILIIFVIGFIYNILTLFRYKIIVYENGVVVCQLFDRILIRNEDFDEIKKTRTIHLFFFIPYLISYTYYLTVDDKVNGKTMSVYTLKSKNYGGLNKTLTEVSTRVLNKPVVRIK